jgi:hypothetical protein
MTAERVPAVLDFDIGARVQCADGTRGRPHNVVVDPGMQEDSAAAYAGKLDET